MNAVAMLIAILRADVAVADLVQARVFGAELPREEVGHMPRPAIVIAASGGGSLGPGARSYVPWVVTRVDVQCYGAAPYGAFEVHSAVYEVMTQLRRTTIDTTVLKDAVVAGGPIQSRDTNTDWPFVLGVYDVSTSAG